MVHQHGVDQVVQPTCAQASPACRPPGACGELHHVEDKVQLPRVPEAGAVEGKRAKTTDENATLPTRHAAYTQFCRPLET